MGDKQIFEWWEDSGDRSDLNRLFGMIQQDDRHPEKEGWSLVSDGLNRLSIRVWSPNESSDGEFCHRCDYTHEGPCLEKNCHDWRVAPRQHQWTHPPVESGCIDIADPEVGTTEEAFYLFLDQRTYCGYRRP